MASNADSIPRIILFYNVFIHIELINRGTNPRCTVWALATRIREIPSYSLSPEAGDPNTFFVVLLRISNKIQGQYLELGHDILFPDTFLYTVSSTHLICR
jgi:hypothetical protein